MSATYAELHVAFYIFGSDIEQAEIKAALKYAPDAVIERARQRRVEGDLWKAGFGESATTTEKAFFRLAALYRDLEKIYPAYRIGKDVLPNLNRGVILARAQLTAIQCVDESWLCPWNTPPAPALPWPT